MKVLVTGGTGNLGSKIIQSLLKKGHCVNLFDLPQANYNRIPDTNRINIFKGNINSLEELEKACEDVDITLHLAAILPPHSEVNFEKTMLVNSRGTTNLIKALEATSSSPIIFTSSVSVYGNTQKEDSPISPNHPLNPTDNYSTSKIEAEQCIQKSKLRYTILRISGVYTATPFEFPSPVQFKADQRIEFIDSKDVIQAFTNAVETKIDRNILNLSGGESWRMMGNNFVNEVYEAFGVKGDVNYPSKYGYFDWYETQESQKLLNYQNTSFADFKKKLSKAFQNF
jgi:nucleoside-diphosphate-sugar epimerase